MADAHELVSPVLQDSIQQRHAGNNSDLIVAAPDVNDDDDVVPSDGSGDSTQRRRLDEEIQTRTAIFRKSAFNKCEVKLNLTPSRLRGFGANDDVVESRGDVGRAR